MKYFKSQEKLVYQIKKNSPNVDFASKYIVHANRFLNKVIAYRDIETRLEKNKNI